MPNPNSLSLEKTAYRLTGAGKNQPGANYNHSKIVQLKKALAYAEAIVTTIPTPLLILYPVFQIKTANKAFYETFKVTPDETEGKMIYNLGNGQWDIPLLKRLLEEILPKHNVLTDFEVDHVFRDIGHKIMLLNARNVVFDDKNDPMILLSIEDITAKRSSESEVEKERKKVLENIPSGLMTLDKEWRFTYCNKKTELIIGKKIADIEGRNIWKILPALVGSTFDKFCCKAMKTGTPIAFEQYFPNLSAWFNVQAFASAQGLSIYFDDITQHKKGVQIKEFERQRIFNLFINAPMPICVLKGPRHVYELANKPYMEMVGLKRDLTGVPISQVFPELKAQGMMVRVKEVYKTGTPQSGNEFPVKFYHPDSGKTEEVIINFVVQPLNDSNGNTEGVIFYASDITNLVNKRKQIEELSRQKDEFIGIASHELKTPVTSIKGYTQILQMRFSQEGNTKAVDLLSRMDGQINKLTHLISDLLDATKIEGGKLQYHEALFDFDEMVTEFVVEMQQISPQHNIVMNLASSIKIYGDRDRIGQVVTNFLSNAIKYSPGKHEIILTTTVINDTIKLCVQDFGIGIPKDKLGKVFDRFYRVSGNKEDTFPGMGLGLFISSEIIKRHDGKVTVNSTKGKGSKFCFFLPVPTSNL